jgi:hypothetical protein
MTKPWQATRFRASIRGRTYVDEATTHSAAEPGGAVYELTDGEREIEEEAAEEIARLLEQLRAAEARART